LEADNFALGASAFEEQMHVGFAGGVSDAQQNHGDEELRHEGVPKNFFSVSEQPGDLVLRKGQGAPLGLEKRFCWAQKRSGKSA
jgi:hypothetical protein